MKQILIAASIFAASILSASAASAVEVGVDTGVMEIGSSSITSSSRAYVTLPVYASADGKKSMGWENAIYAIGNPDYRAFTSMFVFDAKSASGLVFEGRLGAAQVSSRYTQFNNNPFAPSGGPATSSTTSLAYGIGVRYAVQDITLRASIDVMGKFRNDVSGLGVTPLGDNVSGHMLSIGVGYVF